MSERSTAVGNLSRRNLLKNSAAVAAASVIPSFAYAGGSDTIKVGLIGCGGRGSGAARDCASADPGIQIYAMGDLFKDRLEASRSALANLEAKFNVSDDRCFTGFDAYKKVLQTDI